MSCWQCSGSREKSVSTEQVICPVGDFGRLMSLMRYLCENGVGLGHWLEVLDDAGRGVLALHGSRWAGQAERKA